MNKFICTTGLFYIFRGAVRLTGVKKIEVSDLESTLDEIESKKPKKSDSANTLIGLIDFSIGLFLIALSSMVSA